MFEHLDTPVQVFHYQLGAALKMENKVLDMLGDLQEAARHDDLKQLFRHHAEETQQQIANLERSFELMGEKADDHMSPAILGIETEGKSNIKKTDERILDTVILAAAGETEHHEIAVYESLIVNAEARGSHDIARLLRQNLEQEQHTLQEVKQASERVAREAVALAG
jgi:ferritin-like metal-binding protein YciE